MQRGKTMRSKVIVGAAGLGLVAALAACSSSSDTPSTSSSGPAPSGSGDCSAPGVTADSVKVGIMFPATGPSAPSFAGFDKGVQARFDLENANGGVNGRKIETETFDDLGDGAAQVTVATKAVTSENVFGLVAASRVDTAFDFLAQESVPVTGANLNVPSGRDRNVFGAYGTFSQDWTSTSAAKKLKELGVTKVFVLAHNSPGSLGGAQNFIKTAEAEGIAVAGTQFDIPLGTFDATSTAIRLKETGADGIYSPLLVDSSISVASALQQQGVTLKGSNYSLLYSPTVVKQAGPVVNGAWTSVVASKALEVKDPGVTDYLANLKQYQPTADPYQGFTTAGYMSADAFIRGLTEAGDCLSRANYIDKLRAVTDFTAGGLTTETISWAPDKYTQNGNPFNCYWYVQIVNGEFQPDDAATCGELISTK